jgi:hypothetical protein
VIHIVLPRDRYLLTLETLGWAWEAGLRGGDTSTLDRFYRLAGVTR